jgi:hypothetical protein
MNNLIDLMEVRRSRQLTELRAWLDKSLPETLNLLSEVEMLLGHERAFSEKEARVVADFLIKAMRFALHGRQVRTWAASLLEKLGRVAAGVLSTEHRRAVELAATALKAFDAVVCGEVRLAESN